MLNKHNLEIAKLASSENSRYATNNVLVTPERTAVTDGHLLATVTTPTLPDDQAPQIPGFTPTPAFASFMIPAQDALDIAKAIPRGGTIPILENAFVDAGENGTARVAVTDLDRSRVFDIKKPEGTFPKIDLVIPDKEAAELAVALNPALLVNLIRALAPITDKRQQSFILRVKDPESPIRLDFENGETGQKGVGVLMPMGMNGTHGIRARKLVVELLDGHVRNVWSDAKLDVVFINRKGPKIAGSVRWTGKDVSGMEEIPKDALTCVKRLSEPAEPEAGKTPEAPAPEPEARQAPAAVAVEPEAASAPEKVATVATPEPPAEPATNLRAFFASKKAKERAKGRPEAAPAAAEPAPIPTEIVTPTPKAVPGIPKAVKKTVPAVPAEAKPEASKASAPAPRPAPVSITPGRSGYRPSPEALAKSKAASLAYWAGVRARKAAAGACQA